MTCSPKAECTIISYALANLSFDTNPCDMLMTEQAFLNCAMLTLYRKYKEEEEGGGGGQLCDCSAVFHHLST